MIMTSASTRADGSIGLRFSTAELTPEDKTAFFELLNVNLKVLMEPWDAAPEEMHKVAAKLEGKTASSRLRAVLFILWNQLNKPGEFEEFYQRQMAKFIDSIKAKLEQQPA